MMEKKGDDEAMTSYVDDTNYLELYDEKLGAWLVHSRSESRKV